MRTHFNASQWTHYGISTFPNTHTHPRTHKQESESVSVETDTMCSMFIAVRARISADIKKVLGVRVRVCGRQHIGNTTNNQKKPSHKSYERNAEKKKWRVIQADAYANAVKSKDKNHFGAWWWLMCTLSYINAYSFARWLDLDGNFAHFFVGRLLHVLLFTAFCVFHIT